jgi:hypothetical protein
MRGVPRALLALAAAVPLAMGGQAVASAADTWTVQPVSALGGAVPFLQGVSCTSASSCVAVGWTEGALGVIWNGSTWTSQHLPLPPGTQDNDGQPNAVSCPAADSCIAVGDYYSPDNYAPLAEIWDGSTWTAQTPPNPGGPRVWWLNGVSCASASSCVAVGDDVVKTVSETWNGSAWTLTRGVTPAGATEAELNGVSCVSADDCVAVGDYTVKTSHVLAEHWNGSTWARQSAPSPAGVSGINVTGVSCPAADNCIAVGYGTTASADVAFAEHWNGSRWAVQSIPEPSGTGIVPELSAVSCATAGSCIAVGQLTSPRTSLAERYNGHAWFTEATARPEAGKAFSAVSCFAAATCTAVGPGEASAGPVIFAEQN